MKKRLWCTLTLALAWGCANGGGLGELRVNRVEIPPDLREAGRQILAEAIRYDTTNPPGNERPLAEYLVALARSEGLDARVIPTPSFGAPEGRAAAWIRLPGRGSQRPVVLLSHLDVVPADLERWTLRPFEGLAGGGSVVGRGALDAKGIAVTHLLTLVNLKRRGIVLDRDVIALAVPDEETGGRAGAAAIVRDRRDLLRDAEFVLTEGGSILPARAGGAEVWGVVFTEKSPCWLRVRTRGIGGHGSTAPPDSAVHRLVGALERVRGVSPEMRVVPEVARMFRALAPLAGLEDRQGYSTLATALTLDDAFRERFLADPARAALVRDTLVITRLSGSTHTNVISPRAEAWIDARLLPGERCADFSAKIRAAIADPQVEVEPTLGFSAGASSIETPLFAAIQRVAARQKDSAVVIPRVIAGFTDAHYFRDLGIVAYGFVPRKLRPVETRGVHGPNEAISVDNLEFGVQTMTAILRELDAGE